MVQFDPTKQPYRTSSATRTTGVPVVTYRAVFHGGSYLDVVTYPAGTGVPNEGDWVKLHSEVHPIRVAHRVLFPGHAWIICYDSTPKDAQELKRLFTR